MSTSTRAADPAGSTKLQFGAAYAAGVGPVMPDERFPPIGNGGPGPEASAR
ncbi:hypothetical protein ACNAW0_19030 [Micromonospora sp. SL1-18]|uniref:hypothetical protein n=1 Tax=Micromonospora sp. SL1-18 TaxID=3399128 RepID=UPI003A4D5C6A